MHRRYGAPFARAFQRYQRAGTWRHDTLQVTTSQERALHEFNFRFRRNHRSLEEAGFQPATNPRNGTWRWVHPVGFEIWVRPRDRAASPSATGNRVAVPRRVDPSSENPDYGRSWTGPNRHRHIQAASDNQRLSLSGTARPYDRGVIEFFADTGGVNPWTFYPADGTPYGDRFIVYDPQGRRLNQTNGEPRVYTLPRHQLSPR